MSTRSAVGPVGPTEKALGRLRFLEWAGPSEITFVLVHGLGGAHVNWVQVAPSLAAHGRVLVPDLPGFGLTPSTGGLGGLMDLRRSLGRFIEGSTHGRRILIGHSLGGALAMLQAAIEPGSVDGMVLNSSVFPIPASGSTLGRLLVQARRRALPAPAVLAGFALYDTPRLGELVVGIRTSRLDPELVVRLSLRFLTTDPSSIPDDVVRATAELLRRHDADPGARAAFLSASRSMLRFLRRDDLGERLVGAVKAPTLVIHGHADRLVPVSWAAAALARRPDWRGRLLPGVGHVPQMEVPGRWVREVAEWIPTVMEG